MNLPVPNLDDRAFQDFVDEAKRALQRLSTMWQTQESRSLKLLPT